MKRRTFIERLAMALGAVFVPTSLLASRRPRFAATKLPARSYESAVEAKIRFVQPEDFKLVSYDWVKAPVDDDCWVFEKGPADEPVTIKSFEEYKDLHGSDLDADLEYFRKKIAASMGVPERYLLGENVHSVVLDEVGYKGN